MDVGEESRRILVNELTGIGEWMTLFPLCRFFGAKF